MLKRAFSRNYFKLLWIKFNPIHLEGRGGGNYGAPIGFPYPTSEHFAIGR